MLDICESIAFWVWQPSFACVYGNRPRIGKNGKPIRQLDQVGIQETINAENSWLDAAEAGDREAEAGNFVLAVFTGVPAGMDDECVVGEVVEMTPSELAWWKDRELAREATDADFADETPTALDRLNRNLAFMGVAS